MTNNRTTIIAIVIGVMVIGGALAFAAVWPGRSGSAGSAGSGGNAPQATAPSIGNDPFIGSASAPLTLYYWHDFQCPFCARFDTEVLPALVTKYVDAGTLRIVFKDLVFIGPDSQTAAAMSHAVWAAAPAQYDAWQQAVYAHQQAENSGWASEANLLAITRTVPGINVSTVTSLMREHSSTYAAAIQADAAEGTQSGISATPGFWIDGQAISGAQPLSFFETVINADLAKQ